MPEMLLDWVLAGLLGLVVGSFLNVLIHRLPIMIERSWQGPQVPLPHLNLAVPGSHCPHCLQPIAWHDNIPLIGFVVLRGRCRHCAAPIAWQYPLVEAAAAALFVWSFACHADPWQSLAWAGFACTLLALAIIDARSGWLPDTLTQPLTWAGLVASALGLTGVSQTDALAGAVVGYLSLWTVYWAFLLVTGREGMGHGDFKLLAALGAWLGWAALLPLVLIASIGGLFAACWLRWQGRLQAGQAMPFGPCLALAGAWLLFFGTPHFLAP